MIKIVCDREEGEDKRGAIKVRDVLCNGTRTYMSVLYIGSKETIYIYF